MTWREMLIVYIALLILTIIGLTGCEQSFESNPNAQPMCLMSAGTIMAVVPCGGYVVPKKPVKASQ